MCRFFSVLPFILSFSFAAIAAAERPTEIDTNRSGATELLLQFERGDARAYMIELHQDVEALSRRDNSITVDGSIPIQTEVLNTDDSGIAEIAISIDRPEFTIIDSTDEINVRSVISNLRSARITRRVRTDGHRVDAVGHFPDDESNAPITATISDLLTTIWIELPGEEIQTGETWVQTAPMWISEDIDTLHAEQTLRYTLTGFATVSGNELAVIDFVIEEQTNGEVRLDEDGVQTMQINGRGNGTGYLLFDVRAGFVREIGINIGAVIIYEDSSGLQFITSTTSNATMTYN